MALKRFVIDDVSIRLNWPAKARQPRSGNARPTNPVASTTPSGRPAVCSRDSTAATVAILLVAMTIAMMTPIRSGKPMMPNQNALRLIRPMNSCRRMIKVVFTRACPPKPSSG
ncbi:MAG: hypothetical protein ABIQ99_14320 [Thermoflexales bacterium]